MQKTKKDCNIKLNMHHFEPHELRRWGTDNPSQVLVSVHGFAGGSEDYARLAQKLTKTNSGLQVVSYDRKRNPNIKPPRIEGTGAIQANAAELLIVLGESAQSDRINKLSLAGHSLGGPIIAAAISMVYSHNLPESLSNEQPRLAQILDHAPLNLIAPAGFTDAYALMPTSGFAAHSLAKAIFNGAKSIVADADGPAEFWAQRQRAIRAASYLSKFKFSLEECIDACGPQTMQTFAAGYVNPGNVSIFSYRNDEIFSSSKIYYRLKNPDIRGTDFAVYEALKSLNPREAAALMSHLSLAGTAGFMALRAAGIFASENEHNDPFNAEQEKALAQIRHITLRGNHTTPLTNEGARALAEHIKLAA
ncbi:MAG TPA: hypothetical protein PKA29_04085 [Candidatus Saccharibacteria bacterium]|nr:hypothetical protein [Candidatus Saccharibacteria bacterium]